LQPLEKIKKNSFHFILQAPSNSVGWIVVPLAYLIFLQILTGIPKPETLKNLDTDKFLISFSEELFSYPFWLQDLSHLPLFIIFSWAWAWYHGPVKLFDRFTKNLHLYLCLFYACFNELSQFFIPMRFPSPGDLIMNLVGVCLGLYFHQILYFRTCHRIRSN